MQPHVLARLQVRVVGDLPASVRREIAQGLDVPEVARGVEDEIVQELLVEDGREGDEEDERGGEEGGWHCWEPGYLQKVYMACLL